MIVVVLPTLLIAGYYYLIASDQYQTEAHFTIESAAGPTSASSGFGDILGITGALTPSQSQAMGLADYLASQEAVNSLQSRLNLVSWFRRPGTDVLSRLRPDNPTPEDLLHYFQDMVRIHFDKDTGISILTVRAFQPGDSYKLARDLLQIGEARINELNRRTYADGIAAARAQFAEAEQAAHRSERDLTAYRQLHQDINPLTSGQAQTTLVTTMEGNLSNARSQLTQMAGTISPSSPQYRAMASHVRSLEAEIARQNSRLTGGGSTIASRMGGYEDLLAHQIYAQKQYDASAANLDKATELARRQSLYLVRVVEPTMPIAAEYPKRLKVVGTAFMILLIAYAIGWLIVAGVREHTA